jgi:oligosaccharyltransferase complex subunit beta
VRISSNFSSQRVNGDLARGFEVAFESPKSDKLSLFSLGERAYDHILLLPPSGKAYGNALSPNVLLEFLNNDGNILLGLSSDSPTPTAIVSLLLELDIHLPQDRHAVVVDHFKYDAASAPEKHDVIIVEAPKPIRKDVRNYFGGKNPLVVPHAVGQVLGNASPLLAPILRAPSTAYSYNPKDDSESVEDLFASGRQLALVSALQARNSARFTVLGSIEMLQDKWFEDITVNGKSVPTGNRDFAAQVSGWTFKEFGVLKVGKLVHHLAEGGDGEVNPKIYRIKNDVVSRLFETQIVLTC